jgi:hypothetical protein
MPDSMSDFDAESFPESDWDECGDLAWNEFDWERYLREQDDLLHRYLAFYERLKGRPDRIDEVAGFMGWDTGPVPPDAPDSEGPQPREDAASERMERGGRAPIEPYTLHKNPVFVATKAIYLSLTRGWERLAGNRVPCGPAMAIQASLYQGEAQAMLGVQAIDLGDYALAVSLFKRGLQELNRTLALLGDPQLTGRTVEDWRADAQPRLFDLREIWLRVISECREELGHRVDDES